jgi:hypothetical protein
LIGLGLILLVRALLLSSNRQHKAFSGSERE